MTKSEKRERLHLLMPSQTKALLDQLQERTGAGSMTEVIRHALALYDLVSEEIGKGKEIIVRDPAVPDPEKTEQRIRLVL